MKKSFVRMFVGMSIIIVHIVAFFGIVVFQREYIPSEDKLDVALVLLPITAAYLVAVVRSAIGMQSVHDSKELVNINYIGVIGLVTIAFCAGLLAFVFGYPDVGGPTIVELRRWLTVFE